MVVLRSLLLLYIVAPFITVKAIKSGTLRLVGSNLPTEGKVQVFIGGQWVRVCDDGWNDNEASVVCRQLGFSSTGRAQQIESSGSNGMMISNFKCSGKEARLLQCNHNRIKISDCDNHEDAMVMCTGALPALPIRLVDGDIFPFSGRIEIYNNGKWGTVCGKKWTQINTQVVCRQLGYEAPFLSTDLNVPAGTGPILMANVMCKNNHSNLLECSHDGFGNHDCKHVHDVGVKCWSQKHHTLLRLAGGNSFNEGRVEVNYNGVWGTVCDDGWDDNDAGVVCRQLGLGLSGLSIYSASFGKGSGIIFLSNVLCTGSELILARCGHLGVTYTGSCSHNDDAGVICLGGQGIAVRLVGGSSYNEGRVEVNYNGEWGTVCDDGWDDTDASVVCRQLGYGSSGKAIGLAYFGEGSGPILLNNVACTGNESLLSRCGHLGINVTSTIFCAHNKDAGVRCNKEGPLIRLVGGSSYNEGRVELYYNGEWGTVCDDGWDDTDAGVVCRQLGFGSSGTAIGSAGFGQGSGSIWLDGVACIGNESILASCGHLGFNITRDCTHSKDAGVRCNGDKQFSIRLVGGSSYNEGRVEVNYNGEWGTVCNDGWDDTDAGVVCRQLGFGSSGTAIGSAGFGQGSGSIWLDSVTCTGNESTLATCGHRGVGITTDCSHLKDAYITCAGKFSFSTRVHNKLEEDNPTKGGVEILINDKWGLICADGWGVNDAIVVCKEKNLGSKGNAIPYAYNETETIWLSGVNCVGNETQLSFCPHNGIGVMDNCTFTAGVECFGSLIDSTSSVYLIIIGVLITVIVICILLFMIIAAVIFFNKKNKKNSNINNNSRAEHNKIVNPMYTDNRFDEVMNRHHEVTILRCEDHKSRGYKFETQETVINKSSLDHCNDDIINVKYDNVIPDKNNVISDHYDDTVNIKCDDTSPGQSNKKQVVLSISEGDTVSSTSKQTATSTTKTHTNSSTGKRPFQKPIMKSIHKKLLRKRVLPDGNKSPPDHCYDDTVNIQSESRRDGLSPDRSKSSSDHYDDIVTTRCDIALPGQHCPPNEEHVSNSNVEKGDKKSSASEQTVTPIIKAHNKASADKHPHRKPIMKSIHKQLLLRKRNRNKSNDINPGDKHSEIIKVSRHYAVVTLKCDEDNREHEYETIPDVQEMDPRSKTSSDHFYDDIVDMKCDNVLLQNRSTSNEGINVHITKNKLISPVTKPTATPASKIDGNFSTSKDLSPPQIPPKPIIKSQISPAGKALPTAAPSRDTGNKLCTGKKLSSPQLAPKPIMKSNNKPMPPAGKPTAICASKGASNLSSSKDLSPPQLAPKPTMQKSINKPMSPAGKPTAICASKSASNFSSNKDLSPPQLAPKPTMKSINKPMPPASKPTPICANKSASNLSSNKDLSPPQLPPKPTVQKSNNKPMSPASKPTAICASKSASNLSSSKDLSPPQLAPKPTMQKSINKPMSPAGKPTAICASKSASNFSSNKDLSPPQLAPKPTMKSINKPMPPASKPTPICANKSASNLSSNKDLSPPQLPPKPTVQKSNNKPMSPASKPTAICASKSASNLSSSKDLSPPQLAPKPTVQKSNNKPMSPAGKSTAICASKSASNLSSGKDLSPPQLAPKPIMKFMHKPMPSACKPTFIPTTKIDKDATGTPKLPLKPYLPPKPNKMSFIHKPRMISPSNQPQAITENQSDLYTGENLPPIPVKKSIHKHLLTRQRSAYTPLDLTTRETISEYQTTNIPPPLPPKHITPSTIPTNH